MPSSKPHPAQLTYLICATVNVGELSRLVGDSLVGMNAIHVAAAIVRLANLVGTGPGAADEVMPHSEGGHVPPSGRPELGSGRMVDDSARDLAARLLERLGATYLGFCGRGAYVGARQHANVAWAIGKTGLSPPPGLMDGLVEQLLEDGCRRLHTALPQEISNLALGLARLGYAGTAMWAGIAAVTPAKLEQFKPQELANLAWSCAAVQQQQQLQDQGIVRGLVREVALQATARVAMFKPQELASLLWAVAKTGLKSERLLFDAAAVHCLRLLQQEGASGQQPQQLNSQDVANILWAYAKVENRNVPLLEALGDAVSSSSSETNCARFRSFRPQEVSIVLWSYATLQYNHLGVLQAAMQQLSDLSSQLSPQALANACWAAGRLARCRLDGSGGSSSGTNTGSMGPDSTLSGLLRFTRSMSAAASGALSLFSGQELANTLWGLVNVNQAIRTTSEAQSKAQQPQSQPQSSGSNNSSRGTDAASEPEASSSGAGPVYRYRYGQQMRQEGLLLPLVDAATWRAGSMGPSSLAQVAWAGSQMKSAPGSSDSLADAVSTAALPQLHLFGAQELTTLVHCLAHRQERVDWALFKAAGDAAVPLLRDGAFSPSGMANIVWAFARSKLVHPELAAAVAAAALPRMHLFGPQELANLLWGLFQLGLRDKGLLDRAAVHIGSHAWLRQPGDSLGNDSPDLGPSRAVGMATAVVTWCFARCGYYTPRLYDSLAEAALPHLPCIPPYNLAQLLWAFSAHDHCNVRFLEAAAEAVSRRLSMHASARQPLGITAPASRLPPSRGSTGLLPEAPGFTRHDSSLGENTEPMHPSDVAVVAWVYAKLGYPHARLFDSILEAAMMQPEAYDIPSWMRLASSFSALGLPSEELFMGRLQQRSRRLAAKAEARGEEGEEAGWMRVPEHDDATANVRLRPGRWPGGSPPGRRLVPEPSSLPVASSFAARSHQDDRRQLWSTDAPASPAFSVSPVAAYSGSRGMSHRAEEWEPDSGSDDGPGAEPPATEHPAVQRQGVSLLPRPSRPAAAVEAKIADASS